MSPNPKHTRRGPDIALWVGGVFFLALSAWFIPGAIWGTSANSPVGAPLALAMGFAVLAIALTLLTFAGLRRTRRRGGDR